MRRAYCVLVLAAVGCGSSDPPQPKLTDAQIQDVMAKAKQNNQQERGNRGGGGAAPKQ